MRRLNSPPCVFLEKVCEGGDGVIVWSCCGLEGCDFFSRFPLPNFRLVHFDDLCSARRVDGDAACFASAMPYLQLPVRCLLNHHPQFLVLVLVVLPAVHLRALNDDSRATAVMLPRRRLRRAVRRRGSKSFLDRLDHLAEPVEVERVQHHVAPEVGTCKPHGHAALLGESHDVGRGPIGGTLACGEAGMMQAGPHVLVDAHRLIGAPQETAREEGGEQEDAVVPLGAGARHVQFVKEPVHVEERGRELVENKGRAVEVDKRPLREKQRVS